jgi:hypothetical protein
MHQFWTEIYRSQAYNALEMVNGHLEAFFPLDPHHHRLTFLVELGLGRGQI